jgi:hypothetical protein
MKPQRLIGIRGISEVRLRDAKSDSKQTTRGIYFGRVRGVEIEDATGRIDEIEERPDRRTGTAFL